MDRATNCKGTLFGSAAKVFIRLGIALVLIAVFVGVSRLREAGRLLMASRPEPLLASVAIMVAGILVKTIKWQVFLRAEGIRVGYWRLFRYYMVSCFFNVFLPSSVGGDFKRILDVALDTQRRAAAFGSILADRGTGMYVLIVYCFVIALVRWSKIGGWYISGPIALVTAGITVGAPLAVWGFERIRPRLEGWGGLTDKLLRVLQSLVVQVAHPIGLTVGLGLSFVFLLLTIAHVWYVSHALSIALPWEALFVSVPMVFGLASLPITINGIGVREGGFIYFLGLYGVAPESAVAISLGVLAMLICVGMIGGMIFVAVPSAKLRADEGRRMDDRDATPLRDGLPARGAEGCGGGGNAV